MDKALIIGDSGGIGAAVRKRLSGLLGPENVDGLSRSRDGLDIRDEDRVEALMGQLHGPYDLILIATGALSVEGQAPEKSLRALTRDGLISQFETNALGPALVLKHALPLIRRDKRAVLAALSARVGSIGDNRLGGWYGYRASKAALNQIFHSAAIELSRSHRHAICVTLHPGTVATNFTARYRARHPTVEPDAAARHLLEVIEGLTPKDTGRFFDWAGKEVAW